MCECVFASPWCQQYHSRIVQNLPTSFGSKFTQELLKMWHTKTRRVQVGVVYLPSVNQNDQYIALIGANIAIMCTNEHLHSLITLLIDIHQKLTQFLFIAAW